MVGLGGAGIAVLGAREIAGDEWAKVVYKGEEPTTRAWDGMCAAGRGCTRVMRGHVSGVMG